MSGPSPSSHYVGLRLRALIWSCLDCDLIPSAVFYAERYYCIDTTNHQARHLYANALLKAGHTHSALHLVSAGAGAGSGSGSSNYRVGSSLGAGSSTGAAGDQSCLGCAEVFSRCCSKLGRFREGQNALSRCLAKGDTSSVSLEASNFQEVRQFPDVAVLACRAGTLAMRGNQPKEAIAHFTRALALNPFMWEAYEGLSRLGDFPDLDALIPLRGAYLREALAPKNNFPAPSSNPNSNSNINPNLNANNASSFFTPESNSVNVNGNINGGPRIQANGLTYRMNGGVGPRESINSLADSSFGEFNSPGFKGPRNFTADMMLTGRVALPLPPPTLNGHTTTSNGVTGANSSSTTASTASSNDGRPAMKRARGEAGAKVEAEGNRIARAPTNGKRPVSRGVVPDHVREPTRRSTRTNSATKPIVPSKNVREIKRAPRGTAAALTANANHANKTASPSSDDEMMSVDTIASTNTGLTTTAIIPPSSNANAPLPSSNSTTGISPLDTGLGEASRWDINAQHIAEKSAVEEADAYILELIRIFARAVQSMSRYRCQDVIDQLELLPPEQQCSASVMTLLAKAFYEKLDYVKAERCFATAREYDPYRHQDMDLYSTLLWHMSRETHLSYLSQELLAMDNTSPVAWITAGNCFSLQRDHHQALVCFRRATQLDSNPGAASSSGSGSGAYAYALSGHESISVEEPEKAVEFFRQALRLDARCYSAWYGLGMVHYRSNMLDQALWHFRKAIDINPWNAVLICCEGMVHEQKKHWQKALEVYTRAVVVAPNSSLVLFKRVRMLVECGHYEEARDILVHLMEVIPDEVNVPFMLGQVYAHLGDNAQAQRHMTIAQDIEPKIQNVIRMVQQRAGMGRLVLDATAPGAGNPENSMEMETAG